MYEKISIQTGLFYSAEGQEFTKDFSIEKSLFNVIDSVLSKQSGTFNSNMLKLPILFTFDSDGKPGVGKDDGAFDGLRAEAGVYIAYRLSSSQSLTKKYLINKYDSLGISSFMGEYSESAKNVINSATNNISHFDAGIQLGFGIEKSVGIETLLINLNLNLGLLDLYHLETSQKPLGYNPIKYKDWGFSLTYFFPSFKK